MTYSEDRAYVCRLVASISLRSLRMLGGLAVILFVVSLTSSIHGSDATTLGRAGAIAAPAPTAAFQDDPLSIEDRVRCQRRIEQVYWQHRTWPAANPAPKPALGERLTDAMLRERVSSYLEKTTALEIFWSRPLTGDQLQAEVTRMVRETKNPDLLRELFAALDDDPFLVAECLARPVLVDRLTRNWYARDARFHDALRLRAETELEAHSDPASRMRDLDGVYAETEYRLVTEDWEVADLDTVRAVHAVIDLSPEEWHERIGRLMSIPSGSHPQLIEENDRFMVTSVLSSEENRVRIATVSWNKRSFDAWWAEEGRAVVLSHRRAKPLLPPSGGYELQSPAGGGCAVDTWTELWYVPSARIGHTAVWTGAEMIVWGGGELTNTGGRYDPATDSWAETSIGAGVPTGRIEHTAVWTGTEMIVWGGNGGGNTGGRYDPLSDSWTSTSTGTGAPAARRSHAAVWTGTQMIVWGGTAGGGVYPNSGGRYDPLSDSWTATSTGAGVPQGRESFTTVWSGTEMIVWGGWIPDDNLNSGGRYDPATDSWATTSIGMGLPTARRDHTAVWTGTEMIVWGGSTPDGNLNTGARYDPLSDSWSVTSTEAGTPSARYSHSAVWSGSAMIVWGGAGPVELNTGGRYNPWTDSWTTTSTGSGVPTPKQDHTAVWTGTEMIVWSLYDGGRYDPVSNSWTPTSIGAGVPTGRTYPQAVWTGPEMIVWGGFNGQPVNTGGRYNPAIDSWSLTSTGSAAPTGRYGHTAVWSGTEMIVWGGLGGSGRVNTGGRYDPLFDSWIATSQEAGVPTQRTGHTAVWTGTEMIVWGGNGGGAGLNSGGRYDPATDQWTVTSTGTGVPVGSSDHVAVWTGTGMIVWGGFEAGQLTSAGGYYDPLTDSWAATSTEAGVPTGRVAHTAAWTGTEMIVWGGYMLGAAYVDTGGRYDPLTDSWTPTSTGSGLPSERRNHTAVWTGTEMIVWGGNKSPVELDTGGRYDPLIDSWTATSTGDGLPTGRFGHSAVWTGAEMIVWGGDDDTYANSGGLFCACDGGAVRTWYLDVDGDGHGVAITGIRSCLQPPGYVELGGDCDDTSPDIYPDAAENNDGLDNQCPDDHGHGLIDEISGLSGFRNASNENEFSWTAQPGATNYEVARSTDPQFAVDCFVFATANTHWIDLDPVVAGEGHYYLVRSTQPNLGSWGADSANSERTPACP